MTADILIAPFSNSTIRDWPARHYADLIGLLVAELPEAAIRVTGTKNQWLRAAAICRNHPAHRVSNDCGKFSWPEVVARLGNAGCVIGNNSGIAHLAAARGTPTVCVFGGSHQRLEWHPRGPRTVIASYQIACSPCHLDHGALCPYDKACLDRLSPELVATAVRQAMALGQDPGSTFRQGENSAERS